MAILPQEERGWFVEAADAQRRAIYSAIEAKVVKKPSEINVMTWRATISRSWPEK